MLSENLLALTEQNSSSINLPDERTTHIQTVEQIAIWSKFKRLAKGTKELTSVYNLGLTLGNSLNLQEIIQASYQKSCHLLRTNNFALALYDESLKQLDFVGGFCQGQAISPFSVNLSVHRGLTGRVLAEQKPIVVADISQTDDMVETEYLCLEQPIRAWLGVPLQNSAGGRRPCQGVIAVWGYQANMFSQHQVHLLAALATQVDMAIRNMRLFEASQRRALEVAVVNELAQTLMATLDLSTLFQSMMAQIEGLFQVEGGALLLTDRATGDLTIQATLPQNGQPVAEKRLVLPLWHGVTGQVALTGKPIRLAQVRPEQRDIIAQHLGLKARNLLCVPLMLNGQVTGVLELINKQAGHFSEADQQLLSSLAVYAAIGIENARRHAEKLAEKDMLIAAQSQARKQLARELHDGPTQKVSAILMSLEICQQVLTKAPNRLPQELERAKECGEKAIHQLRTMLFGLRSLALERDGLAAALSVWVERRQKEINGAKLWLNINSPQPDGQLSRLDAPAEEAIFAIIQESVNNAVKHAHAKNIRIKAEETSHSLNIVVLDDGLGFEVDKVMSNYTDRGSLGIFNLYEQATLIGGSLNIDSGVDQGTRISLTVPKRKTSTL